MSELINFVLTEKWQIMSITVAFLIGMILSFLAGRSLRISRLKLPFIEFDAIEQEKPDRFRCLTMYLTPGELPYEYDVFRAISQTKDRNILIHLGWHIVCEAYIARFYEYPDDTSLNKSVKEIGSQNSDFVSIFRQTYENNLLGGGKNTVKSDYALGYLSRAIALAERIGPGKIMCHSPIRHIKSLVVGFGVFFSEKYPDFEKLLQNDEQTKTESGRDLEVEILNI